MYKYHKVFSFFFFLSLSCFYFGAGVLFHLNTAFLGNTNFDKFIYIWNIAWWPHALHHHLNPFFPAIVWAPTGINLAKVTSLPALALIGSPITLLFGPIVTYNLMMLFSPALAAWTAYLLAHAILKTARYALITGYLYGYSCYMISHMLGHLNLVAPAFLLPLFPLLLLYWLDHKISFSKSIFFLTTLLTSLFLISSEIFVTCTFFGSLIFSIAIFLFTEKRSDLLQFTKIIFLSYLFTALLISPYLYYFFTDHIMNKIGAGVTAASNDFLDLFIPDALFLLTQEACKGLTSLFTCNIFEWNTYLGLGLITILILYANQFWKFNSGKFLILSVIILTLASFGPSLHIAGFKVLGFPWRFLFMLPILHLIAPARIALLASLPIALCVGCWAQKSSFSIKSRMLLVTLAILFLLPTFHQASRPTVFTTTNNPLFFSAGIYKKYLSSEDNLLILPYFDKGAQLLWQEQSHFSFRMADGYLGDMPAAYQKDAVSLYLLKTKPDSALNKKIFLAFLNNHHITKIIIADRTHLAWSSLLNQIDPSPQKVGGVVLYRLQEGPRH
ncbi:MAG: hypothetical protein ACD_60C00032G0013 [uncultured bacterium]|nr:MAG: hypothetical protein ACD_60C00032G0013 [uncultured bacterium]